MSKLFPNATIRTSAPYRFDIVGSFLRPELKAGSLSMQLWRYFLC